MKRLIFSLIFSLTAALLSSPLGAATVTVNGGQTNQVIEGFGVNANHRSWNGTELTPVIDRLIDEGGMTLFRVIYDNSDWEAVNDNTDSNVFNWTYYNTVYSSAEFTKLWNMVAYLNQRGITDGAIINFMGYGPAWLCGSSDYSKQVLTAGLEDEWAEMITSALYYARNTRGLQFKSVMPNNEPDTLREGIHLSGANQYVTTIRKLAQKLDANGLGDVRIIGPDLTTGDTQYMPEMMADSTVMAKVDHFSLHSYGSNNVAAVRSFINSSAFSNRTIWMTEFNVWCDTCDNGTRGTYDWNYCRGTANYLLGYLANGATAGLVYEGYDSYYAHHGAWGFWGLFAVDNENAAVKTYTPRKNFYTVAQISKFVRPGAQRVNISGTSAPFTPLLAFKHAALGQVTLVGINTSSSATALNGTLASMPNVTSLDLYYTSATANLAYAGSVAVNNGVFSATIPADCVFTLTGSAGASVSITSPASGASFTAPASIPIIATATTSTGSIEAVDFFNGNTLLGEDTSAPYQLAWNNVPMGDYTLTAAVSDTSGNIGVSPAINVSVVGPLAQIAVSPASVTVSAGSSQQFTATAKDSLGHSLQTQPSFSWSASGGSITSSGLFTAGTTAGGPYSIVATNGSTTGTSAITVVTGSAGAIGNQADGTFTDHLWDSTAWINASRFQATANITVTTMFAKVGAITGKYKCAIYSGTSTQPSALLATTAEVTNPTTGWQSFALTTPLTLTSGSYYWLAIWSDSSSAQVYYSNTAGVLRWGSYTYGTWPNPVTTTGGGTLNYSIYVTGLTAPAPTPTLTSIAVTPATPTVQAGTTQQFVATGTYTDGSNQVLTGQVTWASAKTSTATINASGLATPVAAGTTTISATLGAVTASAILTVQAPASLTSIAVTPASPSVATGATQQFAATGTYSNASTQNLTSQVTWASSATARATINSAGLATGVSAGTATISATLGSISGSTVLTVQATPPSIATSSLASGTAGISYSATLAAYGGISPYTWSLASGTLPSGLTLAATTGVISGTPTAAGTFTFTIQLTDTSSPVQTTTKSLSVVIAAAASTSVSIWPTSAAPAQVDAGADSSVELGVKFRSDVAGSITGIRFYKASTNTGTHVGNLWSSTGTLLASATFTNETTAGWQQVNFATPVTISANTVYVASYHVNNGHYSISQNYFASTGVDNPPLHALANGVSGGNGVFRYGTGNLFPNATWNTANYWVDVVFQSSVAVTLSSITITPNNASQLVGITQQFVATGTYTDGSNQVLTGQVTWASAKTSTATINASGLATPVAAGTTTISATLGAVTASGILTVQAPASLTSIAVTPTSPSVVTGATQQFVATGTYSNATTQNLTSQVTWASSATARATINSAGLATSVSAGTTTISAILGSISGSTVLTVQAIAPSISTNSFASGTAGTAYSATLAASGGTAPYTWSLASGTLPSGLTLAAATGVISGTPTTAGTFTFTIQLTDTSSPVQTTTKSLSIVIAPGATTSVSIWPTSAAPAQVDGGADISVELGVKFRSDVAGTITGIRFYKGSTNTGTHVGNLWSSTGTLLASATFTNETAVGWQQVNFATPVTISANTVYVASYHVNNGHYSISQNYFASTGVDNPPLHALRNGVSGGNGVYRYGTGNQFPNATWNTANYWVDVVFQASP